MEKEYETQKETVLGIIKDELWNEYREYFDMRHAEYIWNMLQKGFFNPNNPAFKDNQER